ncbi:daptide-type RiPP biosynthesis aminotransferase [Pseudonocardia sp. HH130630-07]|uniref:daptide-type RiPP biosynthesis aminotransferase n=1 Tax=Pseudonocardia sp. HH130630-07 TaxID=1690815 RepID=UPI000814F806|nr:daptide-type RiPP biosynthesis aminotransferase [Pseudonocardia sp. HH130630-07]ANY09812.1 aminotransferase [Pseudonocardia sp. HH130630-07]
MNYQALWPLLTPPEHQGREDLCAKSAHRVRVTLADGRELLCATSGLWNSNLGYGNPAVADAVADALREASYLSAWNAENVQARQAAAELIGLAGADHYGRVLFSTSGGAANDLAIKLVRQYQVLRDKADRRGILALNNAFHGLTFGAAALTHAQLGQQMYGVDRRLVGHVPANNGVRLQAALERHEGRIAALFVEPVLGSGAIPLSDEFVADILRLRREHGFVLVADEVSTGFGRTGGTVFASDRWPEPPDVLVTAKALTNGTLAASAVIVSREMSEAFLAPDVLLGHAETQAGTPAVGAAISATVAELRRLNTPSLSEKAGRRLGSELAALAAEQPAITSVTGRGCMWALHLSVPGGSEPMAQAEVSDLVRAVRDAGAIVHPGPHCLQLIPALVYEDAEIDELLSTLQKGFANHLTTGGHR